ncbi:MAG: response regulator transcription factor [Chloroflexi bacterium]|nr:response regulator transcription factor [Chloroflexota bacterium]
MLIVEDEPTVRLSLRLACEKAGFTVEEASSGPQALERASRRRPGLVLLDLTLPGLDGIDVCRELRLRDSELPVIMVTARDDEVDRVLGLELGADDYITKPFSPRELIARVRAVLRRSSSRGVSAAGPTLRLGGLTIRYGEREVQVNGAPITLTRTEFEILSSLARHPGRVLTRDQLVAEVWGYDSEGHTRLLDSHIGHLRSKLGRQPGGGKYIATIRDVGYKLACEP